VVVNGNTKRVPGCSTVSQCRSVLTAAGFQPTTAKVDGDEKSGELAGTSPPRGGRAVPGQIVVILISNGKNYTEPPPETVPPPDGTAAPTDSTDAPVSPGTLAPAVPGGPQPGPEAPGRGAGPPRRSPPGQG
jgi:beta-lactam-binding protein with PASTA domain